MRRGVVAGAQAQTELDKAFIYAACRLLRQAASPWVSPEPFQGRFKAVNIDSCQARIYCRHRRGCSGSPIALSTATWKAGPGTDEESPPIEHKPKGPFRSRSQAVSEP